MNRIAFSLFGIDVAWYGIILAFAMFVGTSLLLRLAKKRGFSESEILDYVMVVIPSAIVGARIYYVIFEWHRYKDNFLSVFAIREGGLAIHGAIIGGVISAYIFCKVKKWNFLEWADFTVVPLILGQAIGRWGNYTNGEAHGGPTDLPWGILVGGVRVHPTFLYESIWNICIFAFLVLTFERKKFNGEIFAKYLVLYSVGRLFIEGLRTDSLMFFGLRTAQIVSLLCIVGGILFLTVKRKRQ